MFSKNVAIPSDQIGADVFICLSTSDPKCLPQLSTNASESKSDGAGDVATVSIGNANGDTNVSYFQKCNPNTQGEDLSVWHLCTFKYTDDPRVNPIFSKDENPTPGDITYIGKGMTYAVNFRSEKEFSDSVPGTSGPDQFAYIVYCPLEITTGGK